MGRMLGRAASATLVALAVSAAAGCGGGSGSSGYSLDKTASCFKKNGFAATSQVNHVLPGSEGNLRVALGPSYGNQYVFIVFGKDAKEATATENKAVALAEKSFKARDMVFPKSAVLAGVRTDKNVFYYSDTNAISQIVRKDVESCLS
jgi:hypothetical protein